MVSKNRIKAEEKITGLFFCLPSVLDENFAVTLANRSAALYHLAKYDHALSDIQNAEENNYPKEMLHKLKERKAKCYLAKNDLERALQAFK